jgi:hypothetical protein
VTKPRKRKHKNPAFGKAISIDSLDLRTVNPQGRVDVLAAKVIEQFAVTRAPELRPLLEQQRGVIHAAINEQFGPHVIDLSNVVKVVEPFLPLLGAIFAAAVARVSSSDEQTKPQQDGAA